MLKQETQPPISLLLLSLLIPLYLLLVSLHRIFFSRIAHIPGPRLAALTYLYQVYYDIFPHQGQFLFQCGKLHAKYGPVVRIGPDEIHINDIDFYNEIYKPVGSNRRRNKSPLWFWMAGNSKITGNSTWTSLEHDVHKMRRGAFGLYFSRQRMLELQPRVLDKVELLKENLLSRAGTGESVDLLDAMSALTLEVITDYAFGRKIAVLHRDDFARNIRNLMLQTVQVYTFGRAFPTLVKAVFALPDWLTSFNPTFAGFKGFEEQVDSVAKAAFDEAQAELDSEKDEKEDAPGDSSSGSATNVLHEMVHTPSLPPHEKAYARVSNDAMIFIGAGMETTGRTLATTFYHILANPSILSRVREELHTLMPTRNAPIPTLTALEALPYLTAVLTEGTRIAHGVAGRLARTAPDEDLVYPSEPSLLIPRGTTISQSSYLLHTNSTLFPDPHTFSPERFLGAEGAERARNLVPFGRGARMCVGMNLAWAELYLTVAVLLSRVEMVIAEGTGVGDTMVAGEFFLGYLPKGSRGIRVQIVGERK